MPRIVAAVLLALSVAIVSCDKPKPLVLNWDFSSDTSLSRVGFPDEREVWYVDGPGTIKLKARDGFSDDVTFLYAQVWREGSVVTSVCMFQFPGDVDQTYAAAVKLANKWKLSDRRGIDDFLKTRGKRILLYTPAEGSMSPLDEKQPRSIEIRHGSDGKDNEWCLTLIVGFPIQK